MLREGLSFGVTDGIEAGIRVKLVDENMQIDLTESRCQPVVAAAHAPAVPRLAPRRGGSRPR